MSLSAVSIPGPRNRLVSWPQIDPAVTPRLLFGVRLWISVCLALYVAYALELDVAHWAGTTAAIVCQPTLGASLRKASFRMAGTVIGAVAIVVLTALFPQDRVGFFLGLALWGAACGFVATLLRDFASYGAALAGYTAAIVAGDLLGATGGDHGDVFTLALTRATAICIGIACAAVVLAGTDFGGARRRFAAQLAALVAEIAGGLTRTFSLVGPDQAETRSVRRGLVTRVAGLGPLIDETIGEVSDLRYSGHALQSAADGLFAALSGWRTAANCLERLSLEQGRREAGIVLRRLPPELWSPSAVGDVSKWITAPADLRRVCEEAARALRAAPAATPSLRLLADTTADALLGFAQALDGLALLADAAHTSPVRRPAPLSVPDLLPATINAVRVFVTLGAAELFWVVTGWPSGALVIEFVAITVILLSPRGDQAYRAAFGFLLGIIATAALTAIIEFAVLPRVSSFAGLALVIGVVLVPIGALSAPSGKVALFTVVAVFFIPLLAPENPMAYDTQQFYNTSSAIVAGVGITMLAFLLLPAWPPALRADRLLRLTLRDLRRLAAGPNPSTPHDWENHVYRRLSELPAQAAPVEGSRLVAALALGTAIIRLRRVAAELRLVSDLDRALDGIARGNSEGAVRTFAQMDRRLIAASGPDPRTQTALRARGDILAISEALMQHADYFAAGTPA